MNSLYPLFIDAFTCKYIAKKIKTFKAREKGTEINRLATWEYPIEYFIHVSKPR